MVSKVDGGGFILFKGRSLRIGNPFRKQPVAVRPSNPDGCFDIFFCAQKIGAIDLRKPKACGFVDIASAMPTTPQAQKQKQVEIRAGKVRT